MKTYQLTAHIEKDPESGLYIGRVPSLPGAHTQAESLDELQLKLEEVVSLVLEELSPEELRALPEFVGTQQLRIAI